MGVALTTIIAVFVAGAAVIVSVVLLHQPPSASATTLAVGTSSEHSTDAARSHLFTPEELSKYVRKSTGLYLAILGEVYNVTAGAKHYRPGASYAHFTGRDASRSFATGDADFASLTDDTSGMTLEELKGIAQWYDFYAKHDEYTHVGYVIGRYYDSSGVPSGLFPWDELKRADEIEERRKQRMPACNSRWEQKVGSTVWCSTKSGGIDRSWVGVPRLYDEALDPESGGSLGNLQAPRDTNTKPRRCVCVPPELAGEQPHLSIYEGCEPDAETCNVLKPPS